MWQSEPDSFSHGMLCLRIPFPQHPKSGRCHTGAGAREQEARGRQVTEREQPVAVPTCRAAMSGTGLTGSRTQARLSLKVYSTVSVLMMVQHEPSFSSSRLASFGQGDACGECQTLQWRWWGMRLGRLALPSASWFQHVTALLTGKWGS